MRESFAEYLVKECNLSPSTAFTYEQGLLRLERFTHIPATDLTPNHLREFLRSDYHPSTKSSTLVAMKAYHKWGAVEGMWNLNGIMAVRAPKVIHSPKQPLTPSDALRLVDACKRPNDYRLVILGLYGGLRVTEISRIEGWEDRLWFEGKGRKWREVPVHPTLNSFKQLIVSRRPTADTLKHTARSLSHYTGIAFTPHTLRRTFGNTLSERGVPREVIGALLGHGEATVTERYAPVRWVEKVEAIGKLNYS